MKKAVKINKPKKQGKPKQGVNLAQKKAYSAPKGRISGTNMGSTTIAKSEFVTNLSPSSTFQANKIILNPGYGTMFPWLSTIAAGWEKFRVKKLTFEYKTAQSTLVPGMVMFAPEFNVDAPLPSGKQELLEYAYATRGAIWEDFSMTLPSSAVMNYKDYYIRTGVTPTDSLLYDPLYLIWATDAVSTDVSYIGELWVHYEIELLYPQRLPLEVLANNSVKSFRFPNPANGTPFQNPPDINYGQLNIVVLDSATLLFNEAFEGVMVITLQQDVDGRYWNDFALWGSPFTCATSGENNPSFHDGAGGVGAALAPFQTIVVQYWYVNQAAGDSLKVLNAGFSTYDSPPAPIYFGISFTVAPIFDPFIGYYAPDTLVRMRTSSFPESKTVKGGVKTPSQNATFRGTEKSSLDRGSNSSQIKVPMVGSYLGSFRTPECSCSKCLPENGKHGASN